jgi:RNA polymerase-binding protein DksA
MDEKHLEEFRALLEEHRAETLRVRLRGSEDLSELVDARSAATADDEHDPEGTTLAEEWSRIAGLDAEAEQRLRAIDAAQRRIDDGTYGICESCGKRIPVARLRVRPAATMCVDCASKS